jgi:phosphohistidine swiveling domain-containing protein
MSTPDATVAADPPAAIGLDGHASRELLGGKGAALDRLVEWQLPVPPTGVVTTAAYVRFVAHPDVAELLDQLRAGDAVGDEQVDEIFGAASFPIEDARSIEQLATTLADGRPLAVRSSATVEDLERSSFAGQYRSLLDVDAHDPAALLGAVRAVFASLWHTAPRAYRQAFGIDDSRAAMAVVLMRMVPAKRAGVAFTVDPNGADGIARVETVEGLAESLVSGAETPTASLVSRDGNRDGVAPEVSDALDLALTVERRDGRPQDVEWAWDGERVWIVQARPITVTGAEDGDGFDDAIEAIEALDLTTAGIGEMLPGVLPPLVWSVDSHMVEEAFRHLLDQLGVIPEELVEPRGLLRRVNGRAAMDFSRLQGMAGSLPGSSSADLEAEYFGSRRREREAAPTTPGTFGRIRRAAHDVRVVRARHRALVEVEILVEAVAALTDARGRPPSNDAALIAYQRRLVDLATRGMAAELAVAADATATYRRLQVMLARHVSSVDAGRLADRAVARAGVAVPVSADASAAVFAGPTWAEIGRTPPTPTRRAGASDDDANGFDAVRDDLEAAPGWSTDSIMSRLRLRAMRRLAAEATLRLGLRERAKSALLELGGEVRRVHLEAGRRLVERGQIDEPADVDLLSPAELSGALIDGEAVPRDVLAHRHRWQKSYAQLGPLPARFTGRPEHVEVERQGGTCLEGWAASAGRFRGIATVVRSPTDDLPDDAVLVAEATDPSWSPLFLAAGAIVLDRGGPLSHAAILAREIGVPAVLNVPGATQLLAGHEVTVDGDHGIVIVHDGEASP